MVQFRGATRRHLWIEEWEQYKSLSWFEENKRAPFCFKTSKILQRCATRGAIEDGACQFISSENSYFWPLARRNFYWGFAHLIPSQKHSRIPRFTVAWLTPQVYPRLLPKRVGVVTRAQDTQNPEGFQRVLDCVLRASFWVYETICRGLKKGGWMMIRYFISNSRIIENSDSGSCFIIKIILRIGRVFPLEISLTSSCSWASRLLCRQRSQTAIRDDSNKWARFWATAE